MSKHTGGRNKHHKCLTSQTTYSVEEFEEQHAGHRDKAVTTSTAERTETLKKTLVARPALKRQDREIGIQTNTGTVKKKNTGETRADRVEHTMMGLPGAPLYHRKLQETGMDLLFQTVLPKTTCPDYSYEGEEEELAVLNTVTSGDK